MRTGSQAIADVATPTTTAAATPNTLITPTLMNLTGHQSGSVHNNMLPTGSSNNNNKNVAINSGITDIYAQPNKLAIKAKANLTASKLNAPTVEQSTTKAAISNHSTTTLPKSPSIGAIAALARIPDNTSTTAATLKPIAGDEVAKANQLTIATAPTTTPTAEITCRLGAKELTNSDIDNQVTAMGGMQTMDSMAAAAATTKTTIAAHTTQTAKYISATIGKGGDVAALPHMPQVLRDASVGSLQAQLESQQQVQPQQKEIPATLKSIPAETETTKITETAATLTRVPVTCMSATPATTTTTPNATRTIANAIAAQLAQTKLLKAALASSRAAMANTTSTFAGNDSRAVTARDSCHSSVSACSTGSRTSSTCSTSSESTTSSNASTATDTSSNSSSSSTGTVRTELQQRTSNGSGRGRPTQI
ncbi:uncharacterized protein LOC128870554 [Anastrepha ludens]|uniref:uncharacterized protein LOC128870554 n=1 Tax=Anastrepha ludens TaxID=28586 RepID=UPI0023B0E518|nr:uncharacterized protein LOC128870554 [Anastrepha ludens]